MKSNLSLNQFSSFTPCGSQTLSKMHNRYVSVYPETLVRGKGGMVYDRFGNGFVDLISGLGAVSVGYSNYAVNAAAISQINQGTIFSLPNPIEYEAAKLLTEVIPGTDQWKFGKNGTDGTVMAVRAARAFTGRTSIMTVGYNGCQEMFECRGTRTAGIPLVLREHNHRAQYNQIETFSGLNYHDFACVLLEPMVFEEPKPGFLKELRDLCTRTGTLLICDEVVNGGRWEGFVSSRYFEVKPDIYVLSKGLANGFPLCAVGASRSIMSVFERDDFFASGTFGGECVSLAAAMETVKILSRNIDGMVVQGQQIKDAFNALDWNAKAVGYPTRLDFRFPTPAHRALFWQEMCLNGVLVGYANFIKADNTTDEVNKVIAAIGAAHKVLTQYWTNPREKLVGPLPTEALKKN